MPSYKDDTTYIYIYQTLLSKATYNYIQVINFH